MTTEPLTIGMIGLGTVGSGVAKILQDQAERITSRAGRSLNLYRVAVRDLNKPRAFELPAGVLTEDVSAVINDPEIDIIIELMGGTDAAREVVGAALNAGKDVISANKALLCEHGQELYALAKANGRCIAFEAAVAGGIPIIAAVGQSMSANQITSLEAILNGTSNFILSEMAQKNRPYAVALKEAQELGYAEADPAMDVDGTDAAQKLVILAQLAFGTKVSLDQFPRQGIDNLELVDLQFANELHYTIKLLAVAKLIDGQLEMHVQPTLVHQEEPLAKIEGPFNMIALQGDAVGRTWFSGPGAGQMATASAVVADLIDVAIGRAQLTFPRLDLWEHRPALPLQPHAEMTRRYYLRFNIEDRPHVIADIADVLGKQGISISSVIQRETPDVATSPDSPHPIVPLVIMTHSTTEGKLMAADEQLTQLDSLRPPFVRMPVAD